MQAIYFKGSFELIEKAVTEYNLQFQDPETGKFDLKHCLRSQHKYLMQELVKLYAAQLNALRHFNFNELPPLSTNNTTLSNRLNCSSRTIVNLLKRLETAKVLYKIFRGSNANYYLYLDNKILFFALDVLNAEKIEKQLQETEKSENEKELIVKALHLNTKKSFHHKETENLNNKLNSKVYKSKHENLKDPAELNNDLYGSKKDIFTSNQGRNSQVASRSDQGPQTRNSNSKNTGRNIPHAVPAGAELLQLFAFVASLYIYTKNKIYSRLEFLTDTQIEAIKIYFMAALLEVPANKRQAAVYELQARIYIVEEWLKRDNSRFIPIPSIYFDPGNNTGFEKTKQWLQDQKDLTAFYDKAKAAFIEESRTYKGFQKIFRKGANMYFNNPGSLEGYRKACQYLGKKHPALLEEFNKMILEKQSA